MDIDIQSCKYTYTFMNQQENFHSLLLVIAMTWESQCNIEELNNQIAQYSHRKVIELTLH